MKKILTAYPKAIVHLRQQYNENRLGLFFGAGISSELDFPNWNELVQGIASHEKVNASGILDQIKPPSLTSQTQLLFQHFKQCNQNSDFQHSVYYNEQKLLSEWREIIHSILYKNSGKNREEKINNHPYLKDFIPLINKSELSVNYNFDDSIEFMLSKSNSNVKPNEKAGRAYQAIWDSSTPFKRKSAVIYHPNGYLPHEKHIHQSDYLVFSEDTFSDQLIESMSGKLSTILHQLTKRTCLFVGLSLDDSTLKHLLRQASQISAGTYHYFIRYTSATEKLSHQQRDAIFNSNFDVYNLITLFLDSEGISDLAKLISLEPDSFKLLADDNNVNTNYFYYLIGTVGAGKSTILNYFGGLKQTEEWLEDRPTEMAKPFHLLSSEEKDSVDNWVNNQFKLKNQQLKHSDEGIHIIDRTPLDPLTFTKDVQEQILRAKSMIDAMRSEKVISGHIIAVKVAPSELPERLLSKRKTSWDVETLNALQKKSLAMFNDINPSTVENTSQSLNSTIKAIARIIYIEEYKPADLHNVLIKMSKPH